MRKEKENVCLKMVKAAGSRTNRVKVSKKGTVNGKFVSLLMTVQYCLGGPRYIRGPPGIIRGRFLETYHTCPKVSDSSHFSRIN